MEIKNTIKISAPISPYDTDDIQPTHLAEFGKGGYRSINTLVERDAISNERREVGMVVFVKENKKVYALQNGISNDHWVQFDTLLKGSDDSDFYISTIQPEGSIKMKSAWLNIATGILYFRDPTNSFWKPTVSYSVDGGDF